MRIFAFQGFRYSEESAPDPGELAAPPFDQIDDELAAELRGRSPHHFAHLTRPDGEGIDGARRSKEIHDEWVDQGIVIRDDKPSLYPYSIRLVNGSRRLGLCCLVDVSDEETLDLRPHEQTVDKPLANRLELLEATRIDYEPVFYLADDDGAFERALTEEVKHLQPVVGHRDPEGNEHLLYRLSSSMWLRRYQSLLAERGAAIADGHHRTKVAQLFAREHGAESGSPAGAKMAVLTSVASEGLKIDPIHRVLMVGADLAALDDSVVTERRTHEGGGSSLAAAVAAAEQPAIGVVTADSSEVWVLDPDALDDDAPGGEADLPVVFLHHLLLPDLGLAAEAASDGTIAYRSDPQAAWRAVREGDGTIAFLLPPMTPDAFALATQDGSVLPPKSTRFLPKLVSGMVWCGHDAETT